MNKYLIYPESGDYVSEHLIKQRLDVVIMTADKFVQDHIMIGDDDLLYVSSDTLYPMIKNQLSRKL